MFKAVRWMVAGMVLQLMVGQAFAQPGGGRGGPGVVPNLALTQQKSVQDDLKLSEEQIEKLKQVTTKMRESFGGRTAGGDREELRKKFEESRQVAEKEISGILSAEQSKRLKEITLQQLGPAQLARPELAKEVGLTDDQQAKIKEITDVAGAEARARFQAGRTGGDREEARKQSEAAHKETSDKVLAVLTDDQKKAWEKLIGAPFKGELPPFGGNRPRNKTAN